MKKILLLMLSFVALALTSCREEVVEPKISLTAGEVTETTISFTATPADAEKCAYKVVLATEELPTDAVVLAQGVQIEAKAESKKEAPKIEKKPAPAAKDAKQAAPALACADTELKNRALLAMADALVAEREKILRVLHRCACSISAFAVRYMAAWLLSQHTALGFNGISAALLACSNPIGTIFSSLFISYITVGGTKLSTQYYTKEIADVITALIIYLCGFVLFMKHAMNVGIVKREEKAAATDLPDQTEQENLELRRKIRELEAYIQGMQALKYGVPYLYPSLHGIFRCTFLSE